jgi:L-lactate permease
MINITIMVDTYEKMWNAHTEAILMALSPIEWIVIGIIVLALIMWRPSKIPELAHVLRRAKKRVYFQKYTELYNFLKC